MTEPTQASMRASDADRELTVAQLRDHLAAGRLSMDEFDERVGAAYQARTTSDLADLLRDLPKQTTSTESPRKPCSKGGRVRRALWRFGTVNGVCIGIWAAGGASAHDFWPAFVLIPTGVITLRRVFAPDLAHNHHRHLPPDFHAAPQPREGGKPAAQRAVATVLFVDVVDSTRRAAAMGDAAWRRLADRYERDVSEAIARCGGEVLFTRGDEIVAAFQLPADAVRCATRLTAQVNAVGLQIRAGLHAGEVDRLGPRAEGIVMHIGRRVCEAAAPDQVLVSSTVRDLVAGAGMTFADAGERELKGLDGTYHLYEASA